MQRLHSRYRGLAFRPFDRISQGNRQGGLLLVSCTDCVRCWLFDTCEGGLFICLLQVSCACAAGGHSLQRYMDFKTHSKKWWPLF